MPNNDRDSPSDDPLPRVDTLFPRWRAATRVLSSSRWTEPCDFSRVDTAHVLIGLLQEDYEALPVASGPGPNRQDAAERLFDALRDDVFELFREINTKPQYHELIGAALLVAASCRFAGVAIDRGDLRATRRALLGALADHASNPDPARLRFGRVLVLCHELQPLPDAVVAEPLVRWSELLFVYDRFRGGIGPVVEELFYALKRWLIPRLGSDAEYAFLGLAMAQWSVRRTVDDVDLIDRLSELVVQGDVPAEAEAAFDILFAFIASGKKSPFVSDVIAHLFAKYDRRLNGTQLLELVGLYVGENPLVGVHDSRLVVRIVEAVMRDWRSTTPEPFLMADRRGAHTPLLGNLIDALLQQRRADLLGELLGAWIEVPEDERRDDILFWIVSADLGSGWALASQVCLSTSDSYNVVQSFFSSLGDFLGLALVSAAIEGPEPDWIDDVEPGVPRELMASELLVDAAPVVAAGCLHRVLDSSVEGAPRALVVLKDAGFPLQPYLAKTHDLCLPWSVSLRKPKPDRLARRGIILLTGTYLGELEASAVATIFQQSGIDVTMVSDTALSAGQFMECYANPAYDIVWVIGHGVYDHADPAESHLPMPDKTCVRVHDLESAIPATGARRLLVLNLCDAATALLAGGLPEFGLGVRAASPHQAVIGHRWPVQSWPDAVLVGRLLAEAIAGSPDWFSSYRQAIELLLGGSEAVRPHLDGRAEVDESLRRVIDGEQRDRLGHLGVWGSLAFLE